MGFDRTGKVTTHKRTKILLVDDEPDIVNILGRVLQKGGFEVDAHSSPEAALSSFKPNEYDLVILDIRMPGLNGFALYRKLRQIDHALTACFLSSFEIRQDEFKKIFPSMADNVKLVIKKPVTANNLIDEISPILKTASLARAVPGDHLLVVYETSKEFIEYALEFLKIGIMKKYEDAILITDSMTVDALRSKIAAEWSVDVHDLETSGRLALYTFREWYMPDGKFDLHQSMAALTKRAEQSIARGRNGLRLVGDTNPFFESGMKQALLQYEGAVGNNLDLPVIAVCAYSKDRMRLLGNTNIRLLHQHHKMLVGEIYERA